MQLFVTEYSPYARVARILLREKNLQPRVEEVIARTRKRNSPYYEIYPAGRVPYLALSDGSGVEGSRLILEYLDQLDDTPWLQASQSSDYWEYSRLEESARGVMDGVSVWARELRREEQDRSQVLLAHEKERAKRVLKTWESEINNPLMQGAINYPQLTLACALCMDQWNSHFKWRHDHPKLSLWLKEFEDRPSFKSTAPPSTI